MSKATFERELVVKAKTPKQILYCVVAEPGDVDYQNDFWDADEIEKTAHQYLLESRVVGDSHSKNAHGNLIKADAGVVESFIAPVDFEVGEEKILKGSWVIAIKVNDSEMWAAVEKGDITGVSIGGTGYRIPDGE
jgi:DNA adenine methylase